MSNKRICVEVNGAFYDALRIAGKVIGHDTATVKNRCLSYKFPNYKIVPFRITYTEKRCTKCGKVKLLKEFGKITTSKDGYRSECLNCSSIRRKALYQKNKNKEIAYAKQWSENNPEYDKKYKETHKAEAKEYSSQPAVKDRNNERLRKKRETDVAFRLNSSIATVMRRSLKSGKNGAHWETLVDYDLKKLMIHLESKFTEGMSWDNYGNGKYEWSLDHIIPISKWNITSYECQDFKDCWSLDNLQPLWHTRNMEKGDKPMEPKYLIKPF